MLWNILFLDIDGVLNYLNWYTCDRNPGNMYGREGELDPDCIDRVNRIAELTNCSIVLTSGWRADFENAVARLKASGLKVPIIGKTPLFTGPNINKAFCLTRGNEIERYLKTHKEFINSYCIIEDQVNGLFIKHAPYTVMVDSKIGLTDKDVNLAVKILMKK